MSASVEAIELILRGKTDVADVTAAAKGLGSLISSLQKDFDKAGKNIGGAIDDIGDSWKKLGIRSKGDIQSEIRGIQTALINLKNNANLPFAELNRAATAAEKKISSLKSEMDGLDGKKVSVGGFDEGAKGAQTLFEALAQIVGVAGEVAGAGGDIADSLTGIAEGASSLSDLQNRFGTLALAAAGAVAAVFLVAAAIKAMINSVKNITEVNAEFQSLKASLETVTGSAGKAETAFIALERLAGETPYSVQELNEAYITLANRGLPSTERALISFGNTAASMAKPLQQFIEAVADAATGDFERLKEFGIQAEKEGEKIRFTFKGTETVVQNTSTKIGEYLTKLGENNFAGAMTKQMETLKGAMSNAADAWARFIRELGEAGINTVIEKAIRWFTKLVDKVSDFIDKMDEIEQRSSRTGLLSEMEDINTQIAAYRKQRDQLQAALVAGRGMAMGGRTVYSPAQIPQAIVGIDAKIRELEAISLRIFKAMERLPSIVQGEGVIPPNERDPYKEIIEAAAKKFSIDSNLLRAVIKVETGGLTGEKRETVVNTESGATGVMQILPSTWKEIERELGEKGIKITDIKDPTQNIFAGAYYLKKRIDAAGDLVKGLMGYGEGTQEYANKVMRAYKAISKDEGAALLLFNSELQKDREKNAKDNAKKTRDGINKYLFDAFEKTALDWMDEYGKKPSIISGARTAEQQRKLVAAGKTPAKDSFHLYGNAIDINIPGGAEADYKKFFDLFRENLDKNLPLRWGGEFKDFEKLRGKKDIWHFDIPLKETGVSPSMMEKRANEQKRLDEARLKLEDDITKQEQLFIDDLTGQLDERSKINSDMNRYLIDILRARGNEVAAFGIEQELRYGPVKEDLRRRGFGAYISQVEQAQQMELLQAQFEAISRDLEETFSGIGKLVDQGLAQSGIGRSDAANAGLITAVQQFQQLSAIADQIGDPRLIAILEQYRQQMTGLHKDTLGWTNVLESAAVLIRDSLTDALMGFIDGTTGVKDAFREMARSVLRSITEIMLKMAAATILRAGGQAATNAGQTILGGIMMGVASAHLGGIVNGGTGIPIGKNPLRTINITNFGAVPKYAMGGIAGLKPDETMAILHRNEEVLPANSPRHRDNIAATSGVNVTSGNTRVVLVDDQRSVGDWISSSAGERTILSVLQRKRGQVKEILA